MSLLHLQKNRQMTRRQFLWLTSISAAGLIAGCATNPVTGRRQMMFISEQDEIKVDKQYAPMQFSTDYGVSQDKALNKYVSGIGDKMAALSHRPQMPYSFQVVNATYVNAYAFPGGSIGITRGILLKLDDEAELASLVGHELGHVNARHTAQQMSKGMLSQAVVGGLSVLAGTQGALYGDLAAQVGSIGAGALLASYSRDNEREADALGMQYMVGAGYSADGFVGLMDMLNNLSKHTPSSAELLFATHPMSDERYQTAVDKAKTTYKTSSKNPVYRERYMDTTAKLRAQKGAIESLQKGEENMMQKKFGDAEVDFRKALKIAPNDYAGLVMMSTCQLVQKKYAVGNQYADMAKKVYPDEAQAYHLSGFAKINLKKFDDAYQDFASYEKLLPGNPNTAFFRGYAQEGMQNIPEAAREYQRYLQIVREGEYARYSYRRLQEWRAKGLI